MNEKQKPIQNNATFFVEPKSLTQVDNGIIINIPASEIGNLRAATAEQPEFCKPAKGQKTKTCGIRLIRKFLLQVR